MVLALGWAGYLIPMVLKHQDDLDKSRPVREFSGSLRVLGRSVVRAPDVEPVPTRPAAPQAVVRPAPARTITREAARSAARRRRRVLALLLSTLAVVSVTSYLGYTPWLTTAVPTTLIIAFLVTARLTVRAQQARVLAPTVAADVRSAVQAEVAPADTQADLTTEDTEGLDRAELDAALSAEPVLDEGGLWDPLPVTLPTYVNKARARRTVRTIELTGEGSSAITSSGHDAADSALAAEARESEQAALPLAETEQKAAGA